MQEVLFLALYMISTDTTQDVYRHVFRTMHVEDLRQTYGLTTVLQQQPCSMS